MKSIRDVLREEISFFFVSPALLWQILFLYVPLAAILVFSFLSTESLDGMLSMWTLEHYAKVLTPVYFKVIFHSFILALCTMVLCLLIAYPVAYFLALRIKRFAGVLLFLLILPSWTNFIVQVYAWFFLLGSGAFFSEFSGLLNTYAATLIGMVYCFIPFMIFPLYAILEKFDQRLLEASADLGANRWQTFWKVTFPLTLPGVYAGCLLVFVPAFGEFAIPLLLGGAKNSYFGNVVSDTFLISRDWATGFAFATVGVLFLLSVIMCCSAVMRLWSIVSDKRKKNAYRAGIQDSSHDIWG
jgi:spermidine/putrescine transport system permease protein